MTRKLFIALVFPFLICMVLSGVCSALETNYPALNNTEITLPWQDFMDMLKRIPKPDGPKPATVPEKFVIDSATYELFTERQQIRITATFEITVYSEEWTFIPLLKRVMTLGDFKSTTDGDIIKMGKNSYELFAKAPGHRTITATLYQSGDFNKIRNGYQFQTLDAAGKRELVVVVPEENVDITLSPAAYWTLEQESGATVLSAIPGSASSFSVQWDRTPVYEETDESATATTREKPQPKIMADVYTFAMILENQVSCLARVQYRILNTNVKTLTLTLPASASIDSVFGPPINNWKEIKEGEDKQIVVYLNNEMTGDVFLGVQYKQPIASDQNRLFLPVAEINDVDRQKGWIGIGADQNIEIGAADYTDMAPVDPAELPVYANGNREAFLGFKYIKPGFQIALDLKRNERLTTLGSIIDLAGYTSVMLKDGKFLTMCNFELRNNTQQFLKLNLDQEAEVWSSFVNDAPVKPTRNSDGMLLIPLPRGSAMGKARVEILFLQNKPAMGFMGGIDTNIPMPDIPVMLLMWELYMPIDYDYYSIKGDLIRYLGRPTITDGRISMRTMEVGTGGELADKKPGAKYDDTAASYRKSKGGKEQQVTRLGDVLASNIQVQEEARIYDKIERGLEGGPVNTGQGVLPIQINLPTEGLYFYFQKVMPQNAEQKIRFSYAGGRLILAGKALLLIIILVAALAFGIGFWKWGKGEKLLERGVFIALILALWLGRSHLGLIPVAVGVCAVILVFKLLFRKRPKAKSMAAAAVILAAVLALPFGSRAQGQGSVTMSWNDYMKLREAMEPQAPPPAAIPFNFLFVNADYEAKDFDGAVWFDVTYAIWKYNDDPIEIKLFPNNQAITELESSVKGDRLLNKNGSYYLLCHKPGPRRVQLSFVVKASLDLLNGSFSIQVPSSPRNTFSLAVEDKQLEVTATNGVNAETSYPDGGTRFKTDLNPNDYINVSWKRKPEDISPEERPSPRVEATVRTHAMVTDGLVTYFSRIVYNISHAGIDRHVIELPADVDIIEVNGNDLRNVSFTTEDGKQTIKVLLSDEIIGSHAITIRYESVFSEKDSFSYASPLPMDVDSLNGFVAVSARPEFELTPVSEADADAVDPSEVVGEFSSLSSEPLLFAYKYFEKNPNLEFRASKNQAVSVLTSYVNKADYVAVILNDGLILGAYSCRFETRGRQFFDVVLPENTEVWSVSVNSTPVVGSRGEDNRILVPIKQFLTGGANNPSSMAIEIITLTQGNKMAWGSRRLNFPQIDVPISTLEVMLYTPKEWRLARFGGNMGKPQIGAVELLSYSAPAIIDEISDEQTLQPQGRFSNGAPHMLTQPGMNSSPLPPYGRGDGSTTNGMPAQTDWTVSPEVLIRNYAQTDSNGQLYLGVIDEYIDDSALYQVGTFRQGTLPVTVAIPRTGRWIKFTRRVVEAGDAMPEVTFMAYPELAQRIVKYGLFTVFAILFGLMLYLVIAGVLERRAALGAYFATLLPFMILHFKFASPNLKALFLFVGMCIGVYVLITAVMPKHHNWDQAGGAYPAPMPTAKPEKNG